jgi:hypothetical protein
MKTDKNPDLIEWEKTPEEYTFKPEIKEYKPELKESVPDVFEQLDIVCKWAEAVINNKRSSSPAPPESSPRKSALTRELK